MRWNFISSLILDSRILILLVLVFFTIFVSILLIILDKKTRFKEIKKTEKNIIDEKILELEHLLKSLKSPEEKLGLINQKSKDLFKEVFEIEKQKSYSFLINYFNEKNLVRYSAFCQDMFNIYYSKDRVSNIDVDNVGKKLISLIELSKDVLLKVNRTNNKEINEEKNIEKKINILVSDNLNNKQILKKESTLVDLDTNGGKESYLTSEQKNILESIDKKRNLLDFQERKNMELLKETEEKLKQQQQLELELRKKLEEQKNKGKNIEDNLKKSKINELKILSNQNESCSTNKVWYHDIDIKPIQGKEWVKELKRKKKEDE